MQWRCDSFHIRQDPVICRIYPFIVKSNFSQVNQKEKHTKTNRKGQKQTETLGINRNGHKPTENNKKLQKPIKKGQTLTKKKRQKRAKTDQNLKKEEKTGGTDRNGQKGKKT